MFKLAFASLALCAVPMTRISPAALVEQELEFEVSVTQDGVFAVSPPAAPTGLNAFRITSTPAADPICIVWNYSGVAGACFRVARLDPGEDPNNAAQWDNISGNLASTARSFIDCTALCPGQTYRYKVRSYVNSASGPVYSAYSNVAGANP